MFESMLKYSKNIAQNIRKVNDKAIEDELPSMIRRNWDQLDQGKKNDDNPITPFYTPSYAKKKGFSIPDLKVTGDFRNSFDIDYRGDSLAWGASDRKAPFLLDKYGDDILGLTQDNADKSFEKIYNKDANYINRQAAKYL